jgi:hypothetical protein
MKPTDHCLSSIDDSLKDMVIDGWFLSTGSACWVIQYTTLDQPIEREETTVACHYRGG